MNESDPSSSADVDALRREVSAWLARMQRPDGERYRPELEVWLAADPRHLAAYNRVTERFSDAKILRLSSRYPVPSGVKSRKKGLLQHSLTVASTVVVAGWALFQFHGPLAKMASDGNRVVATRNTPNDRGQLHIVSQHGQIKTIRLIDGSVVTLDTDSRLRIAFTGQSRDLWLEQGRGRFSVAHEGRPFTVYAGSGSITAHGTVFDVSVDGERAVHVALLEGVVDVAMSATDGQSDTRPTVRRLDHGQQIAFGGGPTLPAAVPLAKTEMSWPDGMIEFDSTPLADIVARANRYASRPIQLGEMGLDQMKLSGRFRIDDAEQLADNLAIALDLSADRNDPTRIVLRHR